MDGDSNTDHRSRAFCSSPNSHVFSYQEGSHRPILPRFKKNPHKITNRVFVFSHSIGSRYSFRVVNAMAQERLQCVLSQSHSLYLTLRTASLCPGAHLSAAALPEQRMETPDLRASASTGGCSVCTLNVWSTLTKLLLLYEGCASEWQHWDRETERAGGWGFRYVITETMHSQASGQDFQNESTHWFLYQAHQ